MNERQPRLQLRKFWTLKMGNQERSVFFKVLLLNERQPIKRLLRQKVVTKQTRGNEAAAGYSATTDLPLVLLLRFRLTDAECYINVRELARNASYM